MSAAAGSLPISDARAVQLCAALTVQLGAYRELVALGPAQGELITRNDDEALLELMRVKQELIARAAEALQGFEPELALLGGSRPAGGFSARDAEIDGILGETEKILRDLVEAESQDMEAITARKDACGRRLGQLEKGKSLSRSYLAPRDGKQLDREG